MNNKLLALLLMVMFPGISIAQNLQNYLCTHGNLQRRVEILYETGLSVPCEVHYFKDTETVDQRQVLWRALNETGYCERKTREFIVKLHNLGWNCTQDAGPGAPAAPQQVESSQQAEEPEPDNEETVGAGEDADVGSEAKSQQVESSEQAKEPMPDDKKAAGAEEDS